MWEISTRAELIERGFDRRTIAAAVRAGDIIRARRGCYLPNDAPTSLVEAVRVGGLLACASLLSLLGVFVFDASVLHVHMSRGSSRMRSPHDRSVRLAARGNSRRAVLHWHPLTESAQSAVVDVVDAVIHAVRCQQPRHAVATVDSALHLGLITLEQVGDVFAALPERYQFLRKLIDPRAESGPETLVRLIAASLGFAVELQITYDGVGRVDLVLDGWLVVECDSKAHHSDWRQQLTDYRRDLRLAQLGYCVLRLAAEDILYRPETVVAALRGLRSGHRP